MAKEQLEFAQFESENVSGTVARLFVLCHGFGAPGNDLVPVAREVIASLEESAFEHKVRAIVPVAPLTLEEFQGYEARAWWMLNMRALEDAIGSGDIDALAKSIPPGLADARDQLLKLIQEQTAELNLPLSNVVLGGFSQGAMLSTDVALRLPQKVGGLAVLSGTIICEDEWTKLAGEKRGLNVFQSHGDIDPILPINAAMRLAKMFSDQGANLRFGKFNGPHTIPFEAYGELANLIRDAE